LLCGRTCRGGQLLPAMCGRRSLHHDGRPARGWWVREVGGRSLIGVRGRDAARFLQGLTTNDVLSSRAGEGRYLAFLIPTGRVLADSLIYRLPEEEGQEQSFLLECDSGLVLELVSHLQRYRLRSQLHISELPPEWTVGALLMPGRDDNTPRMGELLHTLRPQVHGPHSVTSTHALVGSVVGGRQALVSSI